MKLRDKNKALVAVAVAAFFAGAPGLARAEDVAAEIRQLKEQMKQLEPLNQPNLNGAHPNIFVMRTQVNW